MNLISTNLEHLCDWCHKDLFENEKILLYLKKRDVKLDTIKLFKLGYSQRFFKGLDPRLHNRLIFPIFDVYGKIVAVAGRALNGEEPVYLNSKYSKTQHLYGLNFSRRSVVEKKYAIVVEGYFDAVVLYQNGIRNVVALSGKYLHREQEMLLNRFTDNVCVVYDEDVDLRSIKQQSVFETCKFVKTPIDPDEFIVKYGRDRFLSFIRDYKLKSLKTKIGKLKGKF